MFSLFRVKFNWGVYLILLLIIRVLWTDISWYSFFAYAITLHQFILLFNSISTVLPIRYLAGLLMCVQMLLGPAFAFNGLDQYQYVTYQMKVPETVYFQYALLGVVLFILGLHVTAGKLKGEQLNLTAIRTFADRSGNLPYYLIGIGFFSSTVSSFFGSSFTFVFVLLGSLKFIGLYMMLLGGRQIKIAPLLLVIGSVIMDALTIAMFHDLLVWIILTGAILAIKYQVKTGVKAAVTVGFILLAVVIQQLKKDYRANIAVAGSGINTFESVYQDRVSDNSLFSYEKLAESNVRINQGYIITNIMATVPEKVPFENGAELMIILESAFLPRILAPNKLNAGDRFIFMKYTGLQLREGTSMGLSAMGDGYINFGVLGGAIFMFFFGLSFSMVLNGFQKYSRTFPVLLLFVPLVFYYPIRPDCELQTSLGHLVKSVMLIAAIMVIWRTQFKKKDAVVSSLVEPAV